MSLNLKQSRLALAGRESKIKLMANIADAEISEAKGGQDVFLYFFSGLAGFALILLASKGLVQFFLNYRRKIPLN